MNFVFVAGRTVVGAEVGMGTAAHLLDRCQAPAEGVVDIPAGRAHTADMVAGIVAAVDLPGSWHRVILT